MLVPLYLNFGQISEVVNALRRWGRIESRKMLLTPAAVPR